MDGLCKDLDYKAIELSEICKDPELAKIFEDLDENTQLLLKSYKCRNKAMKGLECTQVVANVQDTGIGLLNIDEIGDCPHYKTANKE